MQTDRGLLYAAREKGKVNLGNLEVSFYQDFSVEVVKQRQALASACWRLSDIKYAFLFPAVMKVLPPNGRPTSLPTMKESNVYIKMLPATRE